jgi:MFS family permease
MAFGLGCAQLVAWGSLYYAIAILAEPMRTDLGATHSEVFGAFTIALVVSGVLAPWMGRQIDRHGGRAVLASSVLLGALGFAVLASARSVPWLIAGWSIAGVAMAAGLYDACFAAIGQIEQRAFRTVVTGVTLIAGFASTVFWPLSHYLLRSLSWREICWAYAACLIVCAPIYLVVLPRSPHASSRPAPTTEQPAIAVTAAVRARARMLSWAFAGAALVGSSLSAHLVGVLAALALPEERVVWVASSIGVLQVSGRVVDLMVGTRRTAAQLGLFTFASLALAMCLLLATQALPAALYGFALLYGLANGLLTIAKATLPIELLGFHNVGAVLGNFSAPALVARALAPLGFAVLLAELGPHAALVGSAIAGLGSLAAYVLALTHRSKPLA